MMCSYMLSVSSPTLTAFILWVSCLFYFVLSASFSHLCDCQPNIMFQLSRIIPVSPVHLVSLLPFIIVSIHLVISLMFSHASMAALHFIWITLVSFLTFVPHRLKPELLYSLKLQLCTCSVLTVWFGFSCLMFQMNMDYNRWMLFSIPMSQPQVLALTVPLISPCISPCSPSCHSLYAEFSWCLLGFLPMFVPEFGQQRKV